VLIQARNRRRLREGRKQFRFRVGNPKPLKTIIHFPKDLQLVRRFVRQDLVHACHAEDYVVSDHHGTPSTGSEGIQSDCLSDRGGSELDVRDIAQVDELVKVPRDAWVARSEHVRAPEARILSLRPIRGLGLRTVPGRLCSRKA
jgi:hypothetical protein